MKLKAPETVFSSAGFCPGCGHGIVVNAFLRVLDKLNLSLIHI